MKKAIGVLFLTLFLGFYPIDATASYCYDYYDNYGGQVQTRGKGKSVKYAKIQVKGVTNPGFVEKFKTDEFGVFFLCQYDYEDGDYLITARKSGYEEARFLLTMLKDWGAIDFAMEMDKIGQAPNNKGEISGDILSDLLIEFTINTLLEGTSKTNYYKKLELGAEEGLRFEFKNLKSDVYTLTFTTSSRFYKKVIDLKKNMKCDISVELDNFEKHE